MAITRAGDFLYALRIISILTTPWEEQAAFKHGIIDKDGNRLRRFRDLKTSNEKDSFTYLHRLVFNLKRLLGTVPGGKSWIATATASLLLLKEELSELEMTEEEWDMIAEALYGLEEDTPTNVTGDAVSTNVPQKASLVRRKPLEKKENEEDEDDGEGDLTDESE